MIPIQYFPGRVATDPELRYTSKGEPCCEFRVALSDSRKNEHGQWENLNTLFLPVTVWGACAQPAANLTKGEMVTVFGKLITEEWHDKTGQKMSRVKVRATNVLQSIIQHQGGQTPHGGGGYSNQVRPEQLGEAPF